MWHREVPEPLRVLHCPENIAGNPAAIARAERNVGLLSTAVSVGPSPLGYDIDEILWCPEAPAVAKVRGRLALLRRALRDFDVVHFNFGRTIMPPPRPPMPSPSLRTRARAAVNDVLLMRDLPLLKAAGKVVAMTYQGDDARQGEYLRTHSRIPEPAQLPPGYYTSATDAAKRRGILRVDRHADLIYALNPDLLHVLPDRARFLPYASVDPRDWQPVPVVNERPVILHAPTHRGIKGTEFVVSAVDQLRRAGHELEFILVEGLSHVEARRLYSRADLLVDQLLLGWYGALAVELMALGKPVVCYLREDDLRLLPGTMRDDLPVLAAGPSSLPDVLRRFLAMSPEERLRLGERSRAYVEEWHDPLPIAERLADDYRRARRNVRASRFGEQARRDVGAEAQ